MEVAHISSHPSFCNVTLTFPLTTHYPEHHDITLNQRIMLTWCERVTEDGKGGKTKEPHILVCHISNLHGKHEDDVIYPNKFHEIYRHTGEEPKHGRRIHFHGLDRSDYFILPNTIIRIEAAHGGKHSIVVTTESEVEVVSTITKLEKRYGRLFLRCHQSYLVNPDYITNIRRFKVTLSDGTVLPIPEKKYTAFRDKAVSTKRQNYTIIK